MSKPPIIVFAQVPPPEHGQSRMVAEMLRVLRDADNVPDIHHVNARFSISMDDIGVQSVRKLLLTFRYFVECLRIRVSLIRPTLYYIPGPVKWSAVLRDWILLTTLRPWFPQLVFHWHAIGHGEWAHGSQRLRLPGPVMLDRVARWISSIVLREPSLSIAVSHNSTADARAIASQRTCVVPNGIEDPWPDFDTMIGPARIARSRDLAVNPTKPVRVLFLSRGSVEKGLLDALDAVTHWLESGGSRTRPLHLTLAGGMDECMAPVARDRIKMLQSRFGKRFNCDLLKFVEGRAKLACYEQADVFLAPSHWESFGLTVVEAMAAGLPVVAAASDGVSGVLPSGYSYLSPIQNPDGLAKNLQRIIDQLCGPEVEGLISQLRQHFIDHYTHDFFAEGILTALLPLTSVESSKSMETRAWSAEPRVLEENPKEATPTSADNGQESGDEWVKSERRKTEKRKAESRNLESGASILPIYNLSRHSIAATDLSSSVSSSSVFPPITHNEYPLTLSIYLADQNPKLGRSLGISRMTEVVLEEMHARGTMDLRAVASASSIRGPDGMRRRQLPWGTRQTFSRVLTDHLHPLLQLGEEPDVWYFPKGFLPTLHTLCAPSVVTIHDTIVQYYADHFPKWRTQYEYRYWAGMLKHTLRNAGHILTVSHSAKGQIEAFMERHGLPPKEITVTYEPCLYEGLPQPVDPPKGGYLLHLASREPHKRTAWLVRHWLAPENADLPPLHVVGSLPKEVREVVAGTKRINALPFLDDDALQAQFLGARALVFPSEIEGFGLPAVEAYFLGTPVCFVKGTSVEEVLEVATHTGGFHLDQAESLNHAIQAILALPADEIHRCGLKLRQTYAATKVVDRMEQAFAVAAGRS